MAACQMLELDTSDQIGCVVAEDVRFSRRRRVWGGPPEFLPAPRSSLACAFRAGVVCCFCNSNRERANRNTISNARITKYCGLVAEGESWVVCAWFLTCANHNKKPNAPLFHAPLSPVLAFFSLPKWCCCLLCAVCMSSPVVHMRARVWCMCALLVLQSQK